MMARKPTGNPTGRPPKEINWKQFEELCKIQCTEEEICAVLNVCIDTLNDKCAEKYGDTFSKVFKQKREDGRTSLRRAQWKSATESNNTAMQIFLGKNMLGQTDKQEIEQNNSGSIEIVFNSQLDSWSK